MAGKSLSWTEIVRYGAVAVCTAVRPYHAARDDVRNMVGGDHFIEVFVDTPRSGVNARMILGYLVGQGVVKATETDEHLTAD